MEPAWERHDFAACAARLVRVARLNLARRILVGGAIACLVLPLAVGLLGGSRVAIALTPTVSAALLAAGGACGRHTQQDRGKAIARWMGAGNHAEDT